MHVFVQFVLIKDSYTLIPNTLFIYLYASWVKVFLGLKKNITNKEEDVVDIMLQARKTIAAKVAKIGHKLDAQCCTLH